MYRESSAERALLITGFNDRVIAFRRADGAVVWAYELPPLKSGDPRVGPLAIELTEDRVFLGTADALLCFEYFTGRLVGEIKLPEDTRRPQILIDGSDVFVCTTSLMLCLGVDGQLRWQVPHGASLNGSPTLALPGNVRTGDGFGWR